MPTPRRQRAVDEHVIRLPQQLVHSASIRTNRFIAMDLEDPPIDFLALATSMGLPARRIDRAQDIAGAVEEGIASGLPNLIEIPIAAT